MKKFFICSVLALSACVTADNGTGLIRSDVEPKNCEFLYTMDTSTANYSLLEAYNFLEQKIAEQRLIGDTYYIEKEDSVDNKEAIFGPKITYKFKTKVYKCQN